MTYIKARYNEITFSPGPIFLGNVVGPISAQTSKFRSSYYRRLHLRPARDWHRGGALLHVRGEHLRLRPHHRVPGVRLRDQWNSRSKHVLQPRERKLLVSIQSIRAYSSERRSSASSPTLVFNSWFMRDLNSTWFRPHSRNRIRTAS